MVDIFLSYSRKDRERARVLAKFLENQGWFVWWDWLIPVGKTWRQLIHEGLDEAGCVLVLWSRKSISSDGVIEEADVGKERKILVPALIDDVTPPLGFRQIQAANLVDWNADKNNPGFKSLRQAIEAIIGPPKTPDSVFSSIDKTPATAETWLLEELKATTSPQMLKLRNGAGLDYRVIATIPKGTSFRLLQKSGDWCQVRGENGEKGWVHKKFIFLTFRP